MTDYQITLGEDDLHLVLDALDSAVADLSDRAESSPIRSRQSQLIGDACRVRIIAGRIRYAMGRQDAERDLHSRKRAAMGVTA